MDNSKIEWTDHTFNPWEGCQKVAPECDNCYAENRDQRFASGRHWGPKAPRRRTSAANWRKPLKWNRDHAAFYAAHGRRQRVFCASLADVFDNAVDPQWRVDLFDVIRETPNLDWLLLTKRPQNMVKMLPEDWGDGWPHVWLGTSAGTQKTADQNIPHLLATPAAVRFVSAEPLLGPVNLDAILTEDIGIYALTGVRSDGSGPSGFSQGPALDWIIVGGESGPKARPMHPDWARSLRDQCQTAGVAFFFKQWGEWTPERPARLDDLVDARKSLIVRPDGGVTSGLMAYGEDAWLMHRIGKKRAGRLLDGREWNEVPKARALSGGEGE